MMMPNKQWALGSGYSSRIPVDMRNFLLAFLDKNSVAQLSWTLPFWTENFILKYYLNYIFVHCSSYDVLVADETVD